MALTVKEVTDERLGHCALLENDGLEMMVTLDYGPRIVSVHHEGEPNLIYNDLIPGLQRSHGHKMRITLEKSTNPVYCDDLPVRYIPLSDGVSFVQTLSDPAQLELTMDIVFSTEIGSFMVVHSATNKSLEDIKLSIYTETPFGNDGIVFIPQSNIHETDRPSRVLTLFDNAGWNDKRLFIGNQYVTVNGNTFEAEDNGEFQLVDAVPCSDRLKIGVNNTAGFCGYLMGGHALIKRYVHNRNALYPFNSCSAFATANDGYLSIQNMGPFYIIGPGESARHIESWIFAEYPGRVRPRCEDEIDEFINSI